MRAVVEETASTINRLTQDKDEQQELWVHYLESGDDNPETLSVHLARIRHVYSENELLQIAIWKRVGSSSQLFLIDFFDQFTELEQSIMRLLALGATLEEIGSIINVGTTRLYHVISVIREHEVWTRR